MVCPHHDASTDATIRWAIASVIRSDAPPTWVYVIADAKPNGPTNTWAAHAAVYSRARLRRDFTRAIDAYTLSHHQQHTDPPTQSARCSLLLLVANRAGLEGHNHTALTRWWTSASRISHPSIFIPPFTPPRYQGHTRRAGPVFKPPLAMQVLPTYPTNYWRTSAPPWCTGLAHTDLATRDRQDMLRLFPHKHALRWNTNEGTYTDGACIKEQDAPTG